MPTPTREFSEDALNELLPKVPRTLRPERAPMVSLILLEPTRAELPSDCARYARLVSSLHDEGWDVQRSINPAQRRSAVAEVVVRLLAQVESPALDSLESLLAQQLGESLPRRHNRQGRVVIYGADGHVLRMREVR